MYRQKIHETSGIITELWSEVDGLSDEAKKDFLKTQKGEAAHRWKSLERMNANELERMYEKAIIVQKAIVDQSDAHHHCTHSYGCNGQWITELGWEKYIDAATCPYSEPEANRTKPYLVTKVAALRNALTEKTQMTMDALDGKGIDSQEELDE
jgi:hypothetical protein